MQPGQSDAAPAAPRYSATAPATFSVSATRAALTLSGHTISEDHERRLRAIATEHFPELELKVEFRPLGLAPDWWSTATTALLEAIAIVEAPHASVTVDSMSVRGIVSNRSLAEPRLRALQAALPDGAQFDLRLTAIDAAATTADLCKRQIGQQRFAPVYFDESGTRMRTSAAQVLERVAAFADACRDTVVAITGHTDSSGDENVNQALSLARARVVADWLGDRGIDAARLEVAGAGSSQPVADNATRFGRGLNRRIEISVAAPPQR